MNNNKYQERDVRYLVLAQLRSHTDRLQHVQNSKYNAVFKIHEISLLVFEIIVGHTHSTALSQSNITNIKPTLLLRRVTFPPHRAQHLILQ